MRLNTAAEKRKNELKKKYQQIAPSYHGARYGDKKGSFLLEQTNRMVLQILDHVGYQDLSQLTILDVATGTGRNLNLFSGQSKKLYGLDYVYEMLEQCKANLKDSAQIPLLQADAEHLPFQRKSLDLITSCRFFHLIPKELKRSCLKEFSRAVKPDGIILVEFLNACYFLNPRTFLRTIFKSFTEKNYLSRKTFPFGWRYQFPFLEVKAVSGTWYPGFRRLKKKFPRWAEKMERLMLFPPFNILSERILVAFTVKQFDKAWIHKDNISLENAGERPFVIKKLRSFGLKNIFQFLKDKKILTLLQEESPKNFQVLKLRSQSSLSYVTEFEKLQPIGSQQDFASLSQPLQKQVLDALYEFQHKVHHFPTLWPERLGRIFYPLDFLKHLGVVISEKVFSFQDLLRLGKLYFRSRLALSRPFQSALHGDILSGGNLSWIGADNPKIVLLDFESVRKDDFFLYDLVHIACKNPVQPVFQTPWIRNWFAAYLNYFKIDWSEENKKRAVRLLQFYFSQALIRRLHERVKIDPSGSGKEDILVTQQNLKHCFDEAFVTSWFESVLKKP